MHILAILFLLYSVVAPAGAHLDIAAERLLKSLEPFNKKIKSLSANAEWNYQTNLTSANQELLVALMRFFALNSSKFETTSFCNFLK